MADETTVNEASPEEIQEATRMGWADQTSWRGAPEDWVDARTFLDKGRHVLRVSKEKADDLEARLAANEAETARLRAVARAQQAALDAVAETSEDARQAEAEQVVKEIKAQISAASRDGDHEAVAELTEKLVDAKAIAKTAPKEKEGNKGGAAPAEIHPEALAWFQTNRDYVENPRKAALMHIQMQEMRQKGDTRVGKVFLESAAAEVDKLMGGAKGGSSRVAAGNGGRREGAGGDVKKGYADLPADAKAACDKMEARLVGAGKKHKDVASWRAAYSREYYKGEQ